MKNHKKYRRILRNYCTDNVSKFMLNTSLHGLRFTAEPSVSLLGRTFFLCSFIAAFITTAYLITHVYAKWDSTPVIIGISPYPISILKTPFPAVTICNMNQVLNSKVKNYTQGSFENIVLELLCTSEFYFNEAVENSTAFVNNTIKITEFLHKHSQPCSRLLMRCGFGTTGFNCSDKFQEIITDEGNCCVFNGLHPKFLHKANQSITTTLPENDTRQAVNWNPEHGYPSNLPKSYYPQPALGTGISMGLTVILDAELDEYYCSTTNGPGFKVALHNPTETPKMQETGLVVPVGYETRFRIEAKRGEAVPSLRDLDRNARQCIFDDEEDLLFYKFYTRQNCENECQAKHMYNSCGCIPYNLPMIYGNGSLCGIGEYYCISRAKQSWSINTDVECRKKCLPNCFDLSFESISSSVPLVKQNYIIPSISLRQMPKEYVNTNIAMIRFYYSESVFHGNLKNVYIGLTEFLSNTGGIMGLFMGFSFISIAEIFYYAFLQPILKVYDAWKTRKQISPSLGSTNKCKTVTVFVKHYMLHGMVSSINFYFRLKTFGSLKKYIPDGCRKFVTIIHRY